MREFDADGRKRVIYAGVSSTSTTGLLFLKDRTVWTLISIEINVICIYVHIKMPIDFEEEEYVERL